MKFLILPKIRRFIFSGKCPICGRIAENDDRYICNECFKTLRKKAQIKNIDNYYYLFYYDKDIKNVIADYKLKNRRRLGKEIGILMEKQFKRLIQDKEINVVIPVPISKNRYRERGFNQVEELLENIHVKYKRIERIRDTKHMYELLDDNDRKKNIEKAFYSKLLLDKKNILLVDDIVTTGRTIEEMIKELKNNTSVGNIYVFSLAISKIFKRGVVKAE